VPSNLARKVMNDLIKLSDRLVVMSERSVSFLQDLYGVPVNKIDLIPHGIPDVPFVDSKQFKPKFDLDGKQVLLTFGLLSPNKGIEYVIQALPDIVEQHPEVVYLVLGTTHPQIKRNHGEAYAIRYKSGQKLGVEQNIIFTIDSVKSDELVEFIGASSIYITPINQSQIVSGTLVPWGQGKLFSPHPTGMRKSSWPMDAARLFHSATRRRSPRM
jgi:glycosyltransferase involved in cell wall biosynthesis